MTYVATSVAIRFFVMKCPKCKGSGAHRAERRATLDAVLNWMSIKPYSCHDCACRFMRLRPRQAVPPSGCCSRTESGNGKNGKTASARCGIWGFTLWRRWWPRRSSTTWLDSRHRLKDRLLMNSAGGGETRREIFANGLTQVFKRKHDRLIREDVFDGQTM
jgi:hypothetical protein